MTVLVYTLLGGALAIFIIFLLAFKLLRVEPKALAGLMALLVLGVYVPVSIIFWPGADVFAMHLAVYLITVYAMGIIFSQRAIHEQRGDGHWFHWAPAAIIGFFLFIIAVDSILLVVAQKGLSRSVAHHFLPKPDRGGEVSSFFPGTVTHDFREKEEMFNRYLEQRREQKQRDWHVRLGWHEDPRAGRPALFQVMVTDKAGKAVAGADVKGRFIRPADSKQDQAFTMPQSKPGFYQVAINLPEPGQWELLLYITRGDAQHEIRAKTEIEK